MKRLFEPYKYKEVEIYFEASLPNRIGWIANLNGKFMGDYVRAESTLAGPDDILNLLRKQAEKTIDEVEKISQKK